MKKNLFGAVSVALALALAITSFGCESGNDDPVMLATDADNPITEGFTYLASPTEYTAITTGLGGYYDTDRAVGTQGNYQWFSYKDGVNKYNRVNGLRTGVDGTKVGDVILTKAESFTLNADGTYEIVEMSTDKEAFEVVKWDAANAGDDYTIAIPVEFVATVNSPASFAGGVFNGTTYTPAVIDYGEVDSDTVDWRDVLAMLENAISDTEDAAAYINQANEVEKVSDPSAPLPYESQADAVADDLEDLNKAYQLAQICASYSGKDGQAYVTYAVKDTATVGGVTLGSMTYYDKKGGKVVKSFDLSGGEEAVAKGTWEFISGDYLNGKILITSDDVYAYNDAKGTYVGEDGFTFYIDEDFPVASTTTSGSLNQKKARTLTISNGVLTGTRVETTMDPGIQAANNRHWGFRYASGYTTYKAALADAENTTNYYDNEREKSYAWTIVQ